MSGYIAAIHKSADSFAAAFDNMLRQVEATQKIVA